MNFNVSDVVCVGFPCLHLLHGVIIIHSQVHIISASYYPLLSHNKFSTSHGYFTHLERFDQSLHTVDEVFTRIRILNELLARDSDRSRI